MVTHSPETLQKVIPLIRQSVKCGTSLLAIETKQKSSGESSFDTKSTLKTTEETTLKEKQPEGEQNSTAALTEDAVVQTTTETAPDQKHSVSKPTLFKPLKKKEKNMPKQTKSISKDEHTQKQADIIMAQKLDSEQSGMVVTEDPLQISAKYAVSKDFIDDVVKDAARIVNQEDSLADDDSINRRFTVNTVHIHGDSPPIGLSPKYINALKVAKNGRYQDEANLFCENYYQEIPRRSPKEKKKKNSFKENVLESSNSETITSQALSKGELKCHCSVSSGELHVCKENNVEEKAKNAITCRKKKSCAYRKRTYFNNWITYYVKNDHVINDSSWSSSNK